MTIIMMDRDMSFRGEMIAVSFPIVILLFRPDPSDSVFHSFQRQSVLVGFCTVDFRFGLWSACLSSHLHAPSFFLLFPLVSPCSDQITQRVLAALANPTFPPRTSTD